MAQYLETIGVALLAVSGILFGRASSRLRKPYWGAGYVLAFALIGMVVAARWSDTLIFHVPFSWLMAGRREFVALSFACTMLLTTSLVWLPHERQKVMVCLFMLVAVVYFSILPFALPAILQGRLAALETDIDASGVCLQGTSYTCGPAAAVTALRQLGLHGDEGKIAVAASSNPVSGTPPDLLCDALEELYGDQRLECEYRFFHSVTDLRGEGALIVAIRFTLMADHYVTVLEITDDGIVLGDPLEGRRMLSHDEFEKVWRSDAIVLKREGWQMEESGADCVPRRGQRYSIFILESSRFLYGRLKP